MDKHKIEKMLIDNIDEDGVIKVIEDLSDEEIRYIFSLIENDKIYRILRIIGGDLFKKVLNGLDDKTIGEILVNQYYRHSYDNLSSQIISCFNIDKINKILDTIDKNTLTEPSKRYIMHLFDKNLLNKFFDGLDDGVIFKDFFEYINKKIERNKDEQSKNS